MQRIVNVRVDDRLIHGQVSAVWYNFLGANRIMVIDDEASKDSFSKALMKISRPASAKLSVLSKQTATENLINKKYSGDNIFIIFKNLESVLQVIKNGFFMEEINLGHLGKKENTINLSKQIHVTEEDCLIIKELNELGVQFSAKATPDDRGIKVIEMVENILKELENEK